MRLSVTIILEQVPIGRFSQTSRLVHLIGSLVLFCGFLNERICLTNSLAVSSSLQEFLGSSFYGLSIGDKIY